MLNTLLPLRSHLHENGYPLSCFEDQKIDVIPDVIVVSATGPHFDGTDCKSSDDSQACLPRKNPQPLKPCHLDKRQSPLTLNVAGIVWLMKSGHLKLWIHVQPVNPIWNGERGVGYNLINYQLK